MTRRATRVSLWLLVGILHADLAAAQSPRAEPAFPSFQVSLTGSTSPHRSSTRLYTPSDTAGASKRTYWLEGGVIGAAVLGVASFLAYDAIAKSVCSDTDGAGCKDQQGLATVGGAGLGFLIGSLIGKGHAKAEPAAKSAPQ